MLEINDLKKLFVDFLQKLPYNVHVNTLKIPQNMSYPQIRLNKTPEIQDVINFLKNRFKLLNESEILKMALSHVYYSFKHRDDVEELERRAKWEATLPLIELSEEDQASLTEGLKDFKEGKSKKRT